MRELNIQGKDHSPTIQFHSSKNVLEISGESRPEHPREYYQPLVDWVMELINGAGKNPEIKGEYRIVFKMEYMNSISTKIIYDILKKLENLSAVNVIVEWHYMSDDIDMQESGEEYSKLLKLPFVFHSHPAE